MPKQPQPLNPYYSRTDTAKLSVADAEWKVLLSRTLYKVARKGVTEQPFTGKYWDNESPGTYFCAVCGNRLFRSEEKFTSSSGWPSFLKTVRSNSVRYRKESAMEMEVLCGRCGSHLGHLYTDGPPPMGRRFSINSALLEFEADRDPSEDRS
ncbi:MAG: peptide-methionine (R)-S-oxide reductase MsrB [Chlorobiaceae bacterium]|nr:peptide-methionine (R)-S-oxide reductase MsrB [Chlorobiaceae bacterium]